MPVALGFAVPFGRSLVEIVSGHGAGFMDSFAGLVFSPPDRPPVPAEGLRSSRVRSHLSFVPAAVGASGAEHGNPTPRSRSSGADRGPRRDAPARSGPGRWRRRSTRPRTSTTVRHRRADAGELPAGETVRAGGRVSYRARTSRTCRSSTAAELASVERSGGDRLKTYAESPAGSGVCRTRAPRHRTNDRDPPAADGTRVALPGVEGQTAIRHRVPADLVKGFQSLKERGAVPCLTSNRFSCTRWKFQRRVAARARGRTRPRHGVRRDHSPAPRLRNPARNGRLHGHVHACAGRLTS